MLVCTLLARHQHVSRLKLPRWLALMPIYQILIGTRAVAVSVMAVWDWTGRSSYEHHVSLPFRLVALLYYTCGLGEVYFISGTDGGSRRLRNSVVLALCVWLLLALIIIPLEAS